MTLAQLRHLIALAESGSFSKAARAVFLTQPALSRSIGGLESQLGQALFDRIGHRIEPTPYGREMVERARSIVADADAMLEHGKRMVQGDRGNLRVGLGSGPGAMLTPPLLLRVATSHRSMRINVMRGSVPLLLQLLRAGQLDALVIDARSLVPAPDLRVEHLHEMRGAFMARQGHPLARRRSISFEALSHYPIAATPLSDEIGRGLTERYGPAAHPDHCITLRCEELPSLVDVARRSDAVLLAIRAAAPDLIELPVKPVLNLTARFALVTLQKRTEAPWLQILRRTMDALLKD